MNKNITKKAFQLAVTIIKMAQRVQSDKREYVLTIQLIKSGSSIGANIYEAIGAISKADFSAKLSISYKESLETKYWLRLMLELQLINRDEFNSVYNTCDEISAFLYRTIQKTRTQ